jgi:hypothetical protein
MEARNRKLNDWYGKVQRGEIKLPRFQRFEAWDRARISSLMEMVIRNLPLGITLILEVGDEEKFVSRYLETAPTTLGRVSEQLLDGQQRLTALWRVMHNNYELETYFVDLSQFDRTEGQEEREDLSVYWRGRYVKKNGDRYPLWCDDPEECLRRGMVRADLIEPEVIQTDIDACGLPDMPACWSCPSRRPQ